jgi:hypothetical protein
MDVLVAKNIQVAEAGLIQALKPRFWPVPGVGGGWRAERAEARGHSLAPPPGIELGSTV